jgi:hypothetical protein
MPITCQANLIIYSSKIYNTFTFEWYACSLKRKEFGMFLVWMILLLVVSLLVYAFFNNELSLVLKPATNHVCAYCGQPVEGDWKNCAHCGRIL